MDCEQFVREEQEMLWDDLLRAIDVAINGAWSIDSANIASRILQAARLVGATPADSAPYPLVAGGVYATLLRLGGIKPTLYSEAEWRQRDEMMSTTRARSVPRFAATVEAMTADRVFVTT